jgi:hypothetical protein
MWSFIFQIQTFHLEGLEIAARAVVMASIGFKAFSHERAVMFQSKIDFSKIAYPPYAEKRYLLKWLKKIM